MPVVLCIASWKISEQFRPLVIWEFQDIPNARGYPFCSWREQFNLSGNDFTGNRIVERKELLTSSPLPCFSSLLLPRNSYQCYKGGGKGKQSIDRCEDTGRTFIYNPDFYMPPRNEPNQCALSNIKMTPRQCMVLRIILKCSIDIDIRLDYFASASSENQALVSAAPYDDVFSCTVREHSPRLSSGPRSDICRQWRQLGLVYLLKNGRKAFAQCTLTHPAGLYPAERDGYFIRALGRWIRWLRNHVHYVIPGCKQMRWQSFSNKALRCCSIYRNREKHQLKGWEEFHVYRTVHLLTTNLAQHRTMFTCWHNVLVAWLLRERRD